MAHAVRFSLEIHNTLTRPSQLHLHIHDGKHFNKFPVNVKHQLILNDKFQFVYIMVAVAFFIFFCTQRRYPQTQINGIQS